MKIPLERNETLLIYFTDVKLLASWCHAECRHKLAFSLSHTSLLLTACTNVLHSLFKFFLFGQQSKHKVFVAAVISLIVFSALCTHANTYGEEEEDDEDIIKHFEQLLKGKANPPSPVAPQPPPPSDQDNFDKAEEGPSQEAELVQEEGQEDFKEENIKNPEVPSSPSGQSACVCKKYYECNVSGKEDADNPDIGDEDPSNSDLMEVDVRFGPENGPCSHYLEICCDVR